MNYDTWESILYTEEEFSELFAVSQGFNDDFNKNHRVRDEAESFAAFIDKGSDALINDHPDLVRLLK